MSTPLQLADVLQRLMTRPRYRYTAGLVSKLAGVPRGTIENWLDGQVRKPRRWQDLLKVADALRLSRDEANRLLQVAGYPAIEALLAQAERVGDRALLASWAATESRISHTAVARYQPAGTLREHGGDAAATPPLVEALRRFRELGDKEGVTWVLISLADMACYQRDEHQAVMLYQEILRLTRELGYTWGMAASLRRLGWLAQIHGDDAQAIAHYTESLALFRNLGAKAGIISCIASIAGVIGARGQWHAATRLLGAVDALLETIHARMNIPDQAAYDQSVADVRAELDTASFEAAWAQGHALTMEQAIAEALGENA
jgi:hypothetical protein